jgi:hypothetical protein
MTGRRVRRRTGVSVVPVLAAGVVVVVAAGLLWWLGSLDRESAAGDGLDVPSQTSTSSSSAAPSTEVSASPATPARRAVPVAEAPAQVRLPSGTTVAVVAVSTRGNGLLDVPDDIRSAGWWRGGARLGDPFGSTLIAAHIDSSSQGLGPYVELLRMRRGERIVVNSKHLEQHFAVSSLRVVPRGSLAREPGLFAPSGPRRLTMVTCAGPYDAARGGYQNLAVVTARPVNGPRRAHP